MSSHRSLSSSNNSLSSSGDEYESLLSDSSSSATSGGRGRTTPHYGGLPRPLSTVMEEGRASQGTLWNMDDENCDRNNDHEEKKDDLHQQQLQLQHQKQQQQQQERHCTASTTQLSSLPPKQPNIHTKRACRLWITFGFIGIIACLFGGVLDLRKQSLTSSSSSKSTTASSSSAIPIGTTLPSWIPRYDYIIVGGGPAGIITAVKLARKFPTLSVLLLESGTVSQTSVLVQQQSAQTQGSSSHSSRNSNDDSTISTICSANGLTPDRNKFDIPLLWSGIASSSSQRQVYDSDENDNNNNNNGGDSSQPPPQERHLWPMPGNMLVGRGLGGSGLLNAMIYIRSLPADWQAWNLTGWEYTTDVLPHYVALERWMEHPLGTLPDFYQRSTKATTTTTTNGKNTTDETIHNQFDTDKSNVRGTRGPITTMAAGYGADEVGTLFVQAALRAGIPLAKRGFNGGGGSEKDDELSPQASRIGAGMYEYNIRNGVRDSVAQALLGGQRSWPSNLVVRTGHTVTRILTSTSLSDGLVRAHGVTFQTNQGQMGEFLLAHDNDVAGASSQLILSAGAILTPHLLAQSGMGPKGQVLDLPGVGANCHDHPVVALSYELAPSLLAGQAAPSLYTLGNEWEDYQIAANQLEDVWLNTTTSADNLTETQRVAWQLLGTLGTAGFSAGAFLRSPWATRDNKAPPDLQITVFPRVFEPHVTRQRKRLHADAATPAKFMLVTVALLQADARYRVEPVVHTSNSSSSSSTSSSSSNDRLNEPPSHWVNFEAPRMQVATPETNGTMYLSERDVSRIAWGIQELRRIFDTAPLADELQGEAIPGRSVEGDELRAWIHAAVLPNAHWVGTTRMGKTDDPMAVVDETLLVRNTTNLRIVDAGVIPSAPNGNTHSTVTVVASRGAELIAQARVQASSN